MKRTIISLLMTCGLVLLNYGQEIAITPKGDTVVLYSTGKWDYYENFIKGEEDKPVIPFNDSHFSKPLTASKFVSGSNHDYEIWYDPQIWKRIPPGELNADADNAFQMIGGDAYAMLIIEKIHIPMDVLSEIAQENALKAAPDIVMKEREYRIVNNDTMVLMRMEGTSNSMRITYYSYYYSNENCSIQFHTFTGMNIFNEYREALEELLNGLVIPKKEEEEK